MVITCCAYGCLTIANSDNGKSFHRIPKNPMLRAKWVSAIGRKNWTPGSNSCLCSDHFRPEDFEPMYINKKRLKNEVVPSIFTVSKNFNAMRSRKMSLHPQDPLRISSKPGVVALPFVLESNAVGNETDPLSNEIPAEILLGADGTTVYIQIEDTSERRPPSNSPPAPLSPPTHDSPPPTVDPETPREQALKKKLMRQTQKLIEARKLAKKHREHAKRLKRRVEILEAQLLKRAD